MLLRCDLKFYGLIQLSHKHCCFEDTSGTQKWNDLCIWPLDVDRRRYLARAEAVEGDWRKMNYGSNGNLIISVTILRLKCRFTYSSRDSAGTDQFETAATHSGRRMVLVRLYHCQLLLHWRFVTLEIWCLKNGNSITRPWFIQRLCISCIDYIILNISVNIRF
jgi:hypothetical protein